MTANYELLGEISLQLAFLLQKHKTINQTEDFEVKLPQKTPCKNIFSTALICFRPCFFSPAERGR